MIFILCHFFVMPFSVTSSYFRDWFNNKNEYWHFLWVLLKWNLWTTSAVSLSLYQPNFWGNKRLKIKRKVVFLLQFDFQVILFCLCCCSANDNVCTVFLLSLFSVCVVWLASAVDFDFVCANALPAALFDFVCLQWWLFSQHFKRTSLLIMSLIYERRPFSNS